MSKIIGISGISGSGKSHLVTAVATKLNATCLVWDDFDDISEGPTHYAKWYQSGANYDAWDYPKLAQALHLLKADHALMHPTLNFKLLPTNYIIFDSPLGRLHNQTGCFIDVWFHITIPLDVALVRRTLRDFSSQNKTKDELLEAMRFYLESTRPCFFDTAYRENADYVLDGMLPTEALVSQIISNLSNQGIT